MPRFLLIATVLRWLGLLAAFFAIGFVVADAPWEDKAAPAVVEQRDEIRCEGALRLREAATAALGNVRSWRDREPVVEQLEGAEWEIARYC